MKLYDFIFCDDIRYEQNNKLSLMGLYNDCVIIQVNRGNAINWPLPMTLASLLRFQIEANDEKPDNFEFEYFMNGKHAIKIQGQINIDKTDLSSFNLAIKNRVVPIEPGVLGFAIKLLKKGKLLYSEIKKNAIKILYKEVGA
ncbi:MAG: hypothetical protein PVI75_06485 [Gammaproteobacteria bacterium]